MANKINDTNNFEKTVPARITVVESNAHFIKDDLLAAESPLELVLEFYEKEKRIRKSIGLIMRSPGRDVDLSIGLLFSEQFISAYSDIANVKYLSNNKESAALLIQLYKGIQVDPQLFNRNTFSNSSCGLCSRESAHNLFPEWVLLNNPETALFDFKHISQYLQKIQNDQHAFSKTGGMHAAFLFSEEGDLIELAEDVGRHNALDKLIGSSIRQNKLPLNKCALLLSGRCSYELIYKAAFAQIPLIASIGSPSSLAVEWSKELNISLIGFLREDRFNIYNNNGNIAVIGI